MLNHLLATFPDPDRDDLEQEISLRLLETPSKTLLAVTREARRATRNPDQRALSLQEPHQRSNGDSYQLMDRITDAHKLPDYSLAYQPRPCAVCGQTYEPYRHDQRTCSPRCSKEWGQLRAKYRRFVLRCRICGRAASELKDACVEHLEAVRVTNHAKYEALKESGICVQCKRRPRAPDGGLACSVCRYQAKLKRVALRLTTRPKPRGRPVKPQVNITCVMCGVQKPYKPAVIARRHPKYCSHRCQAADLNYRHKQKLAAEAFQHRIMAR